jgi:hypothetical protein
MKFYFIADTYSTITSDGKRWFAKRTLVRSCRAYSDYRELPERTAIAYCSLPINGTLFGATSTVTKRNYVREDRWDIRHRNCDRSSCFRGR